MSEHIPPRKLWRIERVTEETGLPRSSIYGLVSAGQFPAPVHPTPRTAAWISAEVLEWIDEKIRLSREGVA